MLERERSNMVVVDLVMPEMSGPDFCRVLKTSHSTQLLPILMTTSVQGVENEMEGIDSGADEFLIKPLEPACGAHAHSRDAAQQSFGRFAGGSRNDSVRAGAFGRAPRQHTGLHCQRLAAYSIALATALGMPRKDQIALHRGGFLHDIGKIGIPDSILFKRGLLTEEEWQTMRLHTIRGEEICRPHGDTATVLPIIRSHHERWDGSGLS